MELTLQIVRLRPEASAQRTMQDIEKRGSFYSMKLMPDAGTIKTGKVCVVPLHEHLIAQRFLEMVRTVAKGALFTTTKLCIVRASIR